MNNKKGPAMRPRNPVFASLFLKLRGKRAPSASPEFLFWLEDMKREHIHRRLEATSTDTNCSALTAELIKSLSVN